MAPDILAKVKKQAEWVTNINTSLAELIEAFSKSVIISSSFLVPKLILF